MPAAGWEMCPRCQEGSNTEGGWRETQSGIMCGSCVTTYIEQLEGFAYEAWHHLHDALWHPDTQGNLTDEQWNEMKEEAKAFVSRHSDDFQGDLTLEKIELTPNLRW